MTKSIAFFSLGCKVNQAENLSYLEQCRKLNFKPVDFRQKADIYVINTCAVTKEAERQSYQYIRRALRLNPFAFIVVTGCVIKNEALVGEPVESIKIKGIDAESVLKILTIPNIEKEKLIEKIYNFLIKDSSYGNIEILNDINFPPPEESPLVRLNLKITDGCENYCTYCIIPYRRGKVRSLSIEQVIELINKAENIGYKEIVLTGINLGAYGKDFDKNLNKGTPLENLLIRINNETKIHRIRLSSLEILNISDTLIDILKNSNILCRHLHIPLQSGSDKILKAMGRRYTVGQFKEIIEKIRNILSDITITTDVIVGFQSENDEDFDATCKLVQDIGFNRIHIFPFSLRPDTKAALLKEPVQAKVIKERLKILSNIAYQLNAKWLKSWINKEVEVLTENIKNDYMEGLTSYYVRVRFPLLKNVISNQLVNVKIEKLEKKTNMLYGSLVN